MTGIIRDNQTCEYKTAYNAYICRDLKYAMLHIESKDADTETRRVSPVAISGDGYIDLINGPQDHGWCSGYTCQKRLSLFPAVVALNKTYEIYFTGTNPQNLRLHLLNTEIDEGVIVRIWYASPMRLDISVDDNYAEPLNAFYENDQQLRYDIVFSMFLNHWFHKKWDVK